MPATLEVHSSHSRLVSVHDLTCRQNKRLNGELRRLLDRMPVPEILTIDDGSIIFHRAVCLEAWAVSGLWAASAVAGPPTLLRSRTP